VTVGGLAVVTGAFSYSGRFIARELLARGVRVRTLTGHPERHDPFEGRVEVAPLDFADPRQLAASLQGAQTLYNTYWVRFPRGAITFESAVRNTEVLLEAARQASVRRVVHLSVTHADPASPLPYYRGKGLVEEVVSSSPLSYAIVRPTLVYGVGDILINNVAWMLRRFPMFALFGDGRYLVQPIYAGDLAQLAADLGGGTEDDVVDAAGPDMYTWDALVATIARAVSSRARLLHLPPTAALLLSRLIGCLVRDVVLTRDEMAGLMGNLLVSQQPALGQTSFPAWLEHHAARLGLQYASELERHFRSAGS